MASLGEMLMVVTVLLAVLPVGAVDADLTVAKSGKSSYKIVVPDKRTTAIDYTASELRKYVKEIAGVELPIIADSQVKRDPCIFLGPCKKMASWRRRRSWDETAF